jgi:hypothetical protein
MAEIRTHCQSVGATENLMKISKNLAKLVESLEKQQFKKIIPIFCLKKRQTKFVRKKNTANVPNFPDVRKPKRILNKAWPGSPSSPPPPLSSHPLGQCNCQQSSQQPQP